MAEENPATTKTAADVASQNLQTEEAAAAAVNAARARVAAAKAARDARAAHPRGRLWSKLLAFRGRASAREENMTVLPDLSQARSFLGRLFGE